MMSILSSRRRKESSPCPRYPPAFHATVRSTLTTIIQRVTMEHPELFGIEDPKRLGTEDSGLVGKDLLFSPSVPGPTWLVQ